MSSHNVIDSQNNKELVGWWRVQGETPVESRKKVEACPLLNGFPALAGMDSYVGSREHGLVGRDRSWVESF